MRNEIYFRVPQSGTEQARAWQLTVNQKLLRAQIMTHRYRFLPLSVGCEVFVEDMSTGQTMHLSEGVAW